MSLRNPERQKNGKFGRHPPFKLQLSKLKIGFSNFEVDVGKVLLRIIEVFRKDRDRQNNLGGYNYRFKEAGVLYGYAVGKANSFSLTLLAEVGFRPTQLFSPSQYEPVNQVA